MLTRFSAVFLCLASPAIAQDLSAVPHDLAAEVVVLGEVHDNPLHHLGQAELIRRLKPKAVVFEMLSPAQGEQVNSDPRTDLAGLGARIGWEASGWPDYALYQPVFEALGTIPVIGAAAPRDKVRQAFDEGAGQIFGTDAGNFGLDAPLSQPEADTRQQMQFDAHCGEIPREMMGGMVEAQRYRDATFAEAVLAALEAYGAPVVLIAGHGHARTDWGVPAMIRAAAPEVSVYAVGFVEGGSETPFDVTISTEPVDRSDPCAALSE